MPALIRLWAEPAQWRLLYADGRTLIFGWNDPDNKSTSSYRSHALHFNSLAFGNASAAIMSPIAEPPREGSWWDYLWRVPANPPLENDECKLYQALWAHSLQLPTAYRRLRMVGSWAQAL